MVFFYVANLIGYVRVGCLLLASAFSKNTDTFLKFYVTSYLLDAADGTAARALGGISKFGGVLDMVTDRVSTAILLALLQEPKWLFFLILDISSHWFHISASLCKAANTHKESSNRLLSLYYNRTILFIVCFMSEAFLCHQFLMKRGYDDWLQGLSWLLWISGPIFYLKQVINVIQLIEACKNLSKLENTKLYMY
jgi:CDP-diacylglycerol--inositol 3-phosphatidyltransferase